MEQNEREVFRQSWNWHDPLGSGDYTIGKEQFFQMDASHGRVQCNRLLKEPITGPSGSVEVQMEITCGRIYHVLLYDSNETPVVKMRIDREGVMAFYDGNDYIDSGARLMFQYIEEKEWGDNSIGPTWFQSNRMLFAMRSSMHTYRFGGFSFDEGTFTFSLDEKSFTPPLASAAIDISKLELQVETVEAGTAIWLDHYAQFNNDIQTDYENFPHFFDDWALDKYYPQDKFFPSKMSMKNHQHLEICTKYGDVISRMPESILKGSVEFSVMTTDVNQEVAFQIFELGQRRGDEAGGIFVFIYAGLWSVGNVKHDNWEEIVAAAKAGLIPNRGHYYFDSFDPPMKAENNRFYKVKIDWDNSAGTWQLWIDGEPRKDEGQGYERPFKKPLSKGIDTVRLHPGSHVFPHGGVSSYSYWGDIIVKSHDRATS